MRTRMLRDVDASTRLKYVDSAKHVPSTEDTKWSSGLLGLWGLWGNREPDSSLGIP